ncbi:DUF1501 domain-containing protein [Tuwongella immobilis]|uniref:DUF1501 domain-containing protein n=1 Tax=Tuwongella immobilis TaxID=692036 RepID=A0A6C2YLW2_9BACT|nr:DUF1501 domain-containing protein [Tuwongella immobilis]VIP02568.1 hypothetical protein : Uncharacterized protein OS=Chthoniobacter flavus Ellin428 GN=CfE428DRAFT_4047 PE=4 SV=1: DUF1501 [Tuwongella immobilis]VTS01793.1 hypothetical protein : Uncharacterized protein OS=Chthoniobacter flavus Ellin428 GN=CfE428DRAFT_4047 PE=4 SV=1: DUF1501 [Tuwongella immobilis]
MLDCHGGSPRSGDRWNRRQFLKIGTLGLGGFSLVDLLRARARAAESGSPFSPNRKAVIQIWQAGGPSHLDMYDLKPNAPAEVRGEFKPIATNVPGIQISEHLPLQARVMDKMAIVRSAYHTNAGHGMGSQWMLTGYQPTIEVNDNIYPACGSVVAKMKGPNEPGLPAYVTLPRLLNLGKAAYLGASYNPFFPDDDPQNGGFQVRNLRMPGRVNSQRLERRRELLTDLDGIRRDLDLRGDMQGLDTFYREAMEMVTSPKAQKAFDVHKEPVALRDRYGRNSLGQCLLLARRLVEAGVTYVTIQAGGGWDTHGDNFKELKNNLLPAFDRGVAALVEDLADRGLQDDVLVMAMGEFGRTPKINGSAGRDHWPGAMSVLFAGGGLKMGQAIGDTNSLAEYPITKPYTPGCVLSTMYRVLGIDHHHAFYDPAQRPLAILPEGEPIPELIG